jgi:hypothetical protein
MTYAAIYHVTAGDISHYEVIYNIALRQYITCPQGTQWDPSAALRSAQDDKKKKYQDDKEKNTPTSNNTYIFLLDL